MRHVEIIGGGVAGLAAGIGLRRAGVPVTVHEAGRYPRHRLCGEFICGLDDETIEELGIAPALEGAASHTDAAWFGHHSEMLRAALPRPALAVSRHQMDARLAEIFCDLGGDLREHSRQPADAEEGRVLATGRRARRGGRWTGLKAHFRELPLAAGLEVHLGGGGYFGLTRLTNDTVNVCGLIPAKTLTGLSVPSGDKLAAATRRMGLEQLAGRLEAATPVAGSQAGCPRVELGWQAPRDGGARIGDQLALIPPFTGNGMTMAFQGAAAALAPLTSWARGHLSWEEASGHLQAGVRRRFARRLAWSRGLHPLLTRSTSQPILSLLARTGFLPFRPLFHLTH